MVDLWPALLAAAAAAAGDDEDDDDNGDDGSRHSDKPPAWRGLLGTLELFSKTEQQWKVTAQNIIAKLVFFH